MTHIFLDSFPDVLTSASVDLQNESSVAAACARGSHIKGIVHPKMEILCLSAYPKGIQVKSPLVI